MAPKANICLPNGTKIDFEGTLEELKALTDHLQGRSGASADATSGNGGDRFMPVAAGDGPADEQPDIARIVAVIKECDEAEAIEGKVLAKRDVLNRVLMCLWAVHKYINPMLGLTSGEVESITDQLGVKVAMSHASTTLSDRARSYVTADSVRRRGAPVRYRLNRRGVQAFDGVLSA